jgi:hypothetical protein
MTQFSHHKTVLLAMEEAVRRGRPDIAVDMLSTKPTVRAYVRSPASPLGIQLHTRQPFPVGTKTAIILDYGPKGSKQIQFYVVPVTAVEMVIARAKKTASPRPVNPDSDHCYMAPEKLFAKYLNGWGRVPPLGIAGYQQDDWADYNPIPVDAFPPRTPGDTEDEDVRGSPTSWATPDNPFDPVPMNTGENEWHPGK